jgi:hypothetical protein
MNPTLTQEIEWLGLRFLVPEQWQIVRHGLVPEAGSLVLVDRRHQRLNLSWTQCQRRPDLTRLVEDYLGKEADIEPATEIERFTCGRRWRGIRQRKPGGEVISRGVLYHEQTSRLVELLVILPPGAKEDQQLVDQILTSFRVTAAAEECRRWNAFDIALTTPPDFRLSSSSVKPADTTLRFVQVDGAKGKPTRTEATIRRLGMARCWYDGSLERVVQAHFPEQRFSESQKLSHPGSEAYFARGTEPGPPVKRMLRRLRERRVLCWHVPEQNAVYELVTLSPPQRPVLPTDFQFESAGGAA